MIERERERESSPSSARTVFTDCAKVQDVIIRKSENEDMMDFIARLFNNTTRIAPLTTTL